MGAGAWHVNCTVSLDMIIRDLLTILERPTLPPRPADRAEGREIVNVLDEILTTNELGHLLKMTKCGIKGARYQKSDPMPFLKIGRSIRFERAEVLKWARRQAKRSVSENGRRRRA